MRERAVVRWAAVMMLVAGVACSLPGAKPSAKTVTHASPSPVASDSPAPSPSPDVSPSASPASNPSALKATAVASTTAGNYPLAVAFTSKVTGGKAPYTYSWDLDGDGKPDATTAGASMTYGRPELFGVALTVTDANKGTAQSTLLINVTSGLAAGATAGPNPVDPQMLVQFTGAASGGKGPYAYAWTLGDGATSKAQNVNHAYTAKGSYSVKLTVTDTSNGVTATKGFTVSVNTQLSITANSSTEPSPIPSPSTAYCCREDFTSKPSGGSGGYHYSWNFGDPNSGTTLNHSSAQDAYHDYTSPCNAPPGNPLYTWYATVTVTDSLGGKVSTTVTVDYTGYCTG